MTLIERYLQAVKMWLPKEQKDDISAELSEDMHASLEERESALGHKLSESEIRAFLKQRGSPFVVASRFLPQQSLIGPSFFPMYMLVLKIVGTCYVLVWLVMRNASVLVTPALAHIAVVTLIFAMLERLQTYSNQLPAVRNPRLISRTGTCIEIAVNLFVLVWLVESLSSREISIYPGLQITLSAIWPRLFWSYLASIGAIIALSCMNLMRPYWTGTRATLRMVTDAIGAALFCWLTQVNIVSRITAPGLSSEKAIEVTNVINQWMGKLLPWAIIVCVVIFACDVYRIFRLKNRRVQLPPQAVCFDKA